MPFILIDDPQFFGIEVSLNNVLMTGLIISFSKTDKKSCHSKHLKDHTFTVSSPHEERWCVLKSVRYLQIPLF